MASNQCSDSHRQQSADSVEKVGFRENYLSAAQNRSISALLRKNQDSAVF